MFIEFEETPNPDTLKFLPGREVLKRGTREFKSPDEATAAPLAQRLFDIEGVKAVFFATDFISVSKTDRQSWETLKPLILTALMEHFTAGLPVIEEEKAASTTTTGEGSEIERQIRELLETRVKPAVAMDGGNIEFVDFDNGTVFLRMEGACAGCPSSSMTLKHGIETMLKHYIPEVTAVEAI
ncbi:MAG: NifU family protein [Alphaproteobacteria bacterium CG_4_9_14_3_um_filter_47_13]|nr:MAG: NifU family protein [Alphaproteobacteria bacterium CG_4_9_14_3_um_filter_47_13]